MADIDGQTRSDTARPADAEGGADLDIWSLFAAIWRRRNIVIATMVLAAAAAGLFLVTTTPRYISQAKILIENRESQFTRTQPVTQDQSFMSDQAAVQSQVQVLLSRDLAGKVAQSLSLWAEPEFEGAEAGMSEEGEQPEAAAADAASDEAAALQRVANLYFDRLDVYQVGTSRVISVEFSSADADLAARVVNTLSDEYIALQRTAKFDTNQEAIAWLGSQIEDLRDKVAKAEAAVEEFRAESGIFAANEETSLGQQQLSELNSELIRASAARSEAEAKAKLIDRLLKKKGGIEEAADVLNSQLIQRLREQQAAVSRQRAELTATLLPAHPRMRQLAAELKDLENRIADEARKIARGLENTAQVAGAREKAIRENLTSLKQEAGDVSQSEIKLRALEREAAAQRETLESFLRRFREASARQDVESQPANARIISRGTVATTPSYPPKGPIMALASIAGVLLGFIAVFFTEIVARARAAAMPAPAAEGLAGRAVASSEPSLSGSAAEAALQSQTPAIPPPPPSRPEAQPEAGADGAALSPESSSVLPIARRLMQWRESRDLRRIAILRLPQDGARFSSDTAFSFELGNSLSTEGVRCVLVDARPESDGDGKGLRDVMRGQMTLGDALRPAGSNGLSRLGPGSDPSQDDTILGGDRPKLVVNALAGSFDVIVVEAGASNGARGPIAMAKACDLVLLVVPAESLNGAEVKKAIAKLRTDGITHAAVVSRGTGGYTLYDAVSVRPLAAAAA